MSNVANIVGNIVTDSGVDIDTKASLGAVNDFSPAVSAVTGQAYAINVAPILTATANSDTLVGLDINPSYVNGAFTGVNNYALRVTGSSLLNGNLMLGSTPISASAILQADSTTKGFLMPRMTTTQRDAIASPATGLQLYNTTTNKVSVYNGTSWVEGGDNIYTANGTLTSDRTVSLGGNKLSIGVPTTGFVNGSFELGVNNTSPYTQVVYNSNNGGAGAVVLGAGSRYMHIGIAGNSYSFPVNGAAFIHNPYANLYFTGGAGAQPGVGDVIMTLFQSTKNVTIGGVTDAGYKLDVQGSFYAKSFSGLTADSSSSNYAFNISNSGYSTLFKVRNDGKQVSLLQGAAEFGFATINSSQYYYLGNSGSLAWGIYAGDSVYIRAQTFSSLTFPIMSFHGDYGAKLQINNNGVYSGSAIFEIDSTTKGFLPPRMTSTQKSAISTPATGLVIYQTDSTEGLYQYKSTGWESIGGGGTNIYNADGTLTSTTRVLSYSVTGNNENKLIFRNTGVTGGPNDDFIFEASIATAPKLTIWNPNYGGAISFSAGSIGFGGGRMYLSTSGHDITFSPGGVQAVRFFNGTGNVVIQSGGTFADQGYKLDVQGTGRVSGDVIFGSGSGSSLYVKTNQGSASGDIPANYASIFGGNYSVVIGASAAIATNSRFIISYPVANFSSPNISALEINGVESGYGSLLLMKSGGNVGIGATPNSSYKLDVNGTARFYGGSTAGAVFGGGATVNLASDAYMFATSTTGKNAGYTANRFSTSEYASFDLITGASFTAGWSIQMRPSQTRLDIVDRYGSENVRMSFFSGGNVAINTTTDAGYKFDVNGSTRISGLLTTSAGVVGTYANFSGNAAFGTTNQIGIGGNGGFGGGCSYWFEVVSNNLTINATGNTASAVEFNGSGGSTFTYTGLSNALAQRNVTMGFTAGIDGYHSQFKSVLNATGNTFANTLYVRGFFVDSGTITPNSTTVIPIGFENVSGTNLFNSTSGTTLFGGQYSSLNTSAQVQINSTTKGFLHPRMTTTQRNAIASPATGLQVYNTTTNTNDYYNGSAWTSLASGNIYTTDGTLTSDRFITGSSYSLNFTSSSSQGVINLTQNAVGNASLIVYRGNYTNATGFITFQDLKTGAGSRGFSLGIGRSGDVSNNGDFSFGAYDGSGSFAWRQDGRIFNATGNWIIGAGSSDAGYKFDVNGTARVNNNMVVASASTGFSGLTVGGAAGQNHITIDSTQNSELRFSTNGDTRCWFRLFETNSFRFYGGAGITMDWNISNNIFVFSNQSISTGGEASSVMEIRSTNRGFLPPRMTATQLAAISSPAVGLVAYQTDGTEGLYQYKSTGWTLIGGSGGGSGTVTTVSVATANGFAGTVANASTTPAITISTTVTGLLKGNGTAISAATAGTDYLTPTDIEYSVANVTTTYSETATKGTKIIKCDTTGGAFSVTLPTAVGNKALLIIKKVAGSGALTIDGNSTETIDGGTTATINKVYESITLISDNSNWQIV